MRRAQMEIMGLAIVAVLLIIGISFVIRFMLSKEPANFKAQFSSTEISSNTINAFLESTSRDCNGLSMTQLLQDCAQARNVKCLNEQDSCQYVQDAAKEIFKKTLDSWNFAYEFAAYQDKSKPLVHLGSPCPRDKKSKIFNIPSNSGTIYAVLDICNTPRSDFAIPEEIIPEKKPLPEPALRPPKEPEIKIKPPVIVPDPRPTPQENNTPEGNKPPEPEVICTCSEWIKQGCGGFCGYEEMHKKRSCNPQGCKAENQCAADPICTPADPSNTAPMLNFPDEIVIAEQINPLPPTIPQLSAYVTDKETPGESLIYSIKKQNKNIANCWIDDDKFICQRLANIDTSYDIVLEVSDGELKTQGGFKLLVQKASRNAGYCGDKYCDFSSESCGTCEQDCNKCQLDDDRMQCGFNPIKYCKQEVVCPAGKTQFGQIEDCAQGKSFTCYSTKLSACSDNPACGPTEVAIRSVGCA